MIINIVMWKGVGKKTADNEREWNHEVGVKCRGGKPKLIDGTGLEAYTAQFLICKVGRGMNKSD